MLRKSCVLHPFTKLYGNCNKSHQEGKNKNNFISTWHVMKFISKNVKQTESLIIIILFIKVIPIDLLSL